MKTQLTYNNEGTYKLSCIDPGVEEGLQVERRVSYAEFIERVCLHLFLILLKANNLKVALNLNKMAVLFDCQNTSGWYLQEFFDEIDSRATTILDTGEPVTVEIEGEFKL